jgi:hypothetical protein
LRAEARLFGDRFTPMALALVLLYGLLQMRWGERIPASDGLGTYDGRRYGEIARDPRREIAEEGLDLFRLQRILPSAAVHLALRATGSSFETRDIVRAFLVLNCICQVALVLVWRQIARTCGLGPTGTWLGFVLLFLNFANLKQPYYYPVLTDTPAVLLGALAVWLHLRDRPLALFIVILLAAFTWPALFVSASLLFVFDRKGLRAPPPPYLPRALGSALAGLGVALLAGAFLGFDATLSGWISLGVLIAYAAGVAWSLLGSERLFERGTYLRGLHRGRLLLAVATFVVLRVLLAQASTAPGMTVSRHIRHIFLYNWGKPGLFLLAHAVYFGPVVVLLALYWRVARDALHELGLGLTAYAAFQLGHAINPETRQLVDALPLYALLAAMAGERCGLAARHVLLVAAWGLLASKVWLPINQGAWGAPDALPAQLYFMNMGPSMTKSALLVQAGVVVVAAVVLWAALPPAAAALRAAPGRPAPEPR